VAGGRLAAEHLVALGHERIAYVGDDEDTPFGFTSSARRRIGAASVLEAHGAELIVRRGDPGRDHARTLAAGLFALDDPPTAIFAGSDLQALGVLEAAEAAGLDVPADLSVVGFDDVEIARYAGLTTIAQPLEESGVRGARLLLQALDGARRTAHRLNLRLVVRATTAPRIRTSRGKRGAQAGRDGMMRRNQP
jgi:DNA-binding LacI/PurR family transcriptional regulator